MLKRYSWLKRSMFFFLVLVLHPVLLGSCASEKSNGEIKLAPVSALPKEIKDAPLSVREAYQYTLANPEIFDKIPCYCGCGEGHSGEAAHQSVKECFVQEIQADGTVVWDGMGLG